MSKIIRHDFIELSLSYITELKVLDFNSLAGISDSVYMVLHFIEVSLESVFALLVGELNLFQTFGQLSALFFLGSILLVQSFGPLRHARQSLKMAL